MIRPYNRNVLVGNWYEDRVLEEDVIRDYLEKRSKNLLLSQNSVGHPTGPLTLSTVNDGKIHIGDIVMLRCVGTQDQPSSLLPKAYRNDCNIVSNGMIAAGSPSSSINSSSALVIKSVDGSAPGTPLTYGQAFAITTLDGSLYLHSDTRSFDRAAKTSRLQSVEFVSVYNHECDWVATCLNPKFRIEVEGVDIPANEKILILHMKTNKALGVHCDYNNKSKFEIVANTFLNSHKAEEDVNHWKFCTNIPVIAAPK